jgi:sulfur carrier protein ThiS
VKIHLIIRGRIGDDWLDIDRELQIPDGTTLGELIEIADKRGIPLADALANSPHLAHTLMLNGERCPIDTHRDHALSHGDQLYLLAPLAGG